MFRLAARNVARPASALKIARPQAMTGLRFNSGPGAHEHETESYEDFNKRYEQFFSTCSDKFELQRGLNNSFSYDLVPSVGVLSEALKAARRCDDFTTAVRILQSLTFKTENEGQYKAYLEELDPVIKELGIPTYAAIKGQ